MQVSFALAHRHLAIVQPYKRPATSKARLVVVSRSLIQPNAVVCTSLGKRDTAGCCISTQRCITARSLNLGPAALQHEATTLKLWHPALITDSVIDFVLIASKLSSDYRL